MEKRRRLFLAFAALAVLATAVRHPDADIRIETHAANDPAPVRVQAAVDLGLASASILITWTANRLIR